VICVKVLIWDWSPRPNCPHVLYPVQ
jgi:hypothetical protein